MKLKPGISCICISIVIHFWIDSPHSEKSYEEMRSREEDKRREAKWRERRKEKVFKKNCQADILNGYFPTGTGGWREWQVSLGRSHD